MHSKNLIIEKVCVLDGHLHPNIKTIYVTFIDYYGRANKCLIFIKNASINVDMDHLTDAIHGGIVVGEQN